MKQHVNIVKVATILDKRHKTAEDDYILKIDLYNTATKKRVYISTKYRFTLEAWDRLTNGKRLTEAEKKAKDTIDGMLAEAKKQVEKLRITDLNQIKSILTSKNLSSDLIGYYQNKIKELKENERLGNATAYRTSLNSILDFHNSKAKTQVQKIAFTEITVKWLNEYEKFMLKKGKSTTSIGIYLRCIRALFNEAISNKDVNMEDYPFGKRKYVIPSSKSVKKALTLEELKLIQDTETDNYYFNFAKDFFLLIFHLQGINIKDLAQLKIENIKKINDKYYISYLREKTKNTTKANNKEIIVPINNIAMSLILKHGKLEGNRSDFVFEIMDPSTSQQKQFNQVKAFTRKINQHLKNFAKTIGITEEISTYYARHSFATLSIQNGASIEAISEALGHQDLKTTKHYFSGFNLESKFILSENTENLLK